MKKLLVAFIGGVVLTAVLFAMFGGEKHVPPTAAQLRVTCWPYHVSSASDTQRPSAEVLAAAERCRAAVTPRATIAKVVDWDDDGDAWEVDVTLTTGSNHLSCKVPKSNFSPVDPDLADLSTPLPECADVKGGN